MWSIFKKNNKSTSSGVFVPKGDIFVELEGDFSDKSINSIAQFLGYNSEMFSSYFIGESDQINCVAFEQFTSNILFISTKTSVTHVSRSMVKQYLKDHKTYFDSYDIESTLSDAIDNKSLTSQFLFKVLNLSELTTDGIVYSEKLGLYLHFNNGYLTDFQSADGLNSWAKDWKNINPNMIVSYEKEAKKYWGEKNISKIINEINMQANAWADLPSPVDNPYIILHTTPFGNVNYYNLLIAHYDEIVTEKEFLEINHGRFEILKSQNETKRYKVGKFIYEFDLNGNILNSYSVN